MKNVYLIACTNSKQNYCCTAEKMYMKSTIYRLSYEYSVNRVIDKDSQIYILSAKHYLLSLSKVIEPYNKTLLNMSSTEKKEWGTIVYEQMKNTFDMNNTHFIFLCGSNYTKYITPFLEKSQYSIPIPIHYGIGRRMKWLKDNMNNNLIEAKKLRDKENLSKIPDDVPGFYKWWAREEAVKMLLNSPYISRSYYHELIPNLTTKIINGKKYYYIYVGIAVKESIRARLNWHINQHHSKTSVESGFLSTLRQSISSLVAFNQYDEDATNNFIDMLIVEYYPINGSIKSKETKEKIEEIEKEELLNNMLLLNLKDNKNWIVKDYLKELGRARKLSKTRNK